jgi:hypothetical protein
LGSVLRVSKFLRRRKLGRRKKELLGRILGNWRDLIVRDKMIK